MIAWWIAGVSGALSALFSSLHFSLRTLSRGELRALGARHSNPDRAERILDNLGGYSLAVSLLRVASNMTLVAAMLLTQMGAGRTIGTAGLIVAVVVAGLVIYVLGSVTGQSLADHVGAALVFRCEPLLRVSRALLSPVVRFLAIVDVVVKRLAGVQELTDAEELEREIRSVVFESEEEGRINETERSMIEAIVDFSERTVEEVMTPRTEIEGIELSDDLDAIRRFIEEAGHSRIPVYEGDLDHIVGVLHAKDLLAWLGRDTKGFSLRSTLREARFVPETKTLGETLAEFQRDKTHLAFVLDEYGGTAGLVTIEDIVEEIVGEIHDEHEPEDEAPPEILLLPEERAAEFDARATIVDSNEELSAMDAELPEGEEYDTVGGFVLCELGHIPVAGERFRKNGWQVTVLSAEPTRVTRVRVEFVPPPPSETPDAQEKPQPPGAQAPAEASESLTPAASPHMHAASAQSDTRESA